MTSSSIFSRYHGVYDFADSYGGPYVHQLVLLRELANDDKHQDTAPALLTAGSFSFRGTVTFARVTRPEGWTELDIQ